VYAIDERTVLRRYRTRTVPEAETVVMRHARAAGYPVPELHSVSGHDIVLERVDGPTMRQALERDPSTLEWHARTFAALHERLFTINAPAMLRAVGDGDTLLHLDFHPENVLMGRDGPMVIDWANAARGHWADDVAMTVVIVKGVLLPEPLPTLARHFAEIYLASFDRDVVRAHLPMAIARRTGDPNLSAAEHQAAREVTV
jgi:tRNA A-37 threonylcarbamoyl transferase component Bud32